MSSQKSDDSATRRNATTSKRNRSKRAPAARKLAVDSRLFADLQGRIAAIGKAQAVIEFQLDGTIVGANENFLKTVGYRLEEVEGQHHSMFVEPAYRAAQGADADWQES